MAVLAMGIAGAAIGGGVAFAAGASAATILTVAQIGFTIGTILGMMLFPPKGPTMEGPRAGDLKMQAAAYGEPLTRIWGAMRTAGNLIYAEDIKEVRIEEEVGGGKGFGGPSATQVTYEYYATFAVGVCQGPITKIGRIWADNKIIGANGQLKYECGFTQYFGDEAQLPDPTLESYLGAGNVPAHRGLAYVVFRDLPLKDFGNRIPNLEFEVGAFFHYPTSYQDYFSDQPSNQIVADPPGNLLFALGYRTAYDTGDGYEEINRYERLVTYDTRTRAKTGETIMSQYWIITDQDPANTQGYRRQDVYEDGGGIGAFRYLIDGSIIAYASVRMSNGLFNASDNRMLLRAYPGEGTFRVEFQDGYLDTNASPAYDEETFDVPEAMVIDGAAKYVMVPLRNGNDRYARLQLGQDSVPSTFDGIIGRDTFPISHPNPSRLRVTGDENGNLWWLMEYRASEAQKYRLFRSNPDYTGMTDVTPWPEQYYMVPEDGAVPLEFFYEIDSKLLVIRTKGTQDFVWAPTDCTGEPIMNVTGSFNGFVVTVDPTDVSIVAEFSVPDQGRPNNIYNDTMWMWHGDPQSIYDEDYIIPAGLYAFNLRDGGLDDKVFYRDAASMDTTFQFVAEYYIFAYHDRSIWGGTETATGLRRTALGSSSFAGEIDRVSVRQIITDLCLTTGLKERDIDVAQMTSLCVGGFAVRRVTHARAAIETLQRAFFFDGFESGGKVKFKVRGAGSVKTINVNDLGMFETGEMPPRMEEKRTADLEIPKRVFLTYVDAAKDYQSGTQQAARISQAMYAEDDRNGSLPILMTATEAKRIAEKQLFLLWANRTEYSFSLPLKYLDIDPSDVVSITLGGKQYAILVSTISLGGNNMLQFSGVSEEETAYVSSPSTGAPSLGYSPATLKAISGTVPFLLDLPLLLDAHDDWGIYWTAYGEDSDTAYWAGCTLYETPDGTTYTVVGSLGNAATYGTTSGTLAAGTTGDFDRVNTIDVDFATGHSLASVTERAVLEGFNWFMIGDELVGAATITQISATRYRLSTLLRGFQGTEWAIGQHASNERVVKLNPLWVQNAPLTASVWNAEHLYKFVPTGSDIDTAPVSSITPEMRRLIPFAPAHVTGTRDINDDLTVTWFRRARVDNDWQDLHDVALDEPTEEYEVDIMSGSTVLRTMTATSDEVGITYTAAMQNTDGITPGDPVTVKVYQISSRVGRGYPATATV